MVYQAAVMVMAGADQDVSGINEPFEEAFVFSSTICGVSSTLLKLMSLQLEVEFIVVVYVPPEYHSHKTEQLGGTSKNPLTFPNQYIVEEGVNLNLSSPSTV